MVRSGFRQGVSVIVVLVVVSGALALAGCKGTKRVAPTSTTTSASPSVDAATAAARADILVRFKAYLAALEAAEVAGDYESAELMRYLADPLNHLTRARLYDMKQHGAGYRGKIIDSPKVTEVHLDTAPQRATVENCVDSTDYRLVYTANNSPVAVPSGSRRYIVTVRATLYPGQGWLFDTASSREDPSC